MVNMTIPLWSMTPAVREAYNTKQRERRRAQAAERKAAKANAGGRANGEGTKP